MNEKVKWYVKQDRDKEDTELNSFTITTNPIKNGWNTDSGYHGYGLPKELAEWICKILNESGENPPYINNGWWLKTDD